MTTPAIDYLSEVDRYSAHNYHPLPIVLERGEGAWVWDVEGKKYLDCLAAYSAVNQGHRHPAIIAAAKNQLDRITLTSRAFHNDQMGPFLHELCTLAGYERALPMNAGAEAVETAIKAVRRWGYRVKRIPADKARIIVCAENFHGRPPTIISASSDPHYRADFGPFTPGFVVIPFGDAHALEAQAIEPFDLVVVNLYPFEEVSAQRGVTETEAVEMIDIGGPAVLRAAAENFSHGAPVARPQR